MCVETTARDASDRGFNVVIVEDATATFEPKSHIASLYNFAKTYGLVRSTDEVIHLLSQRDGSVPFVG
jgi:nicotinamidase-related amidase